MYPTMDMTAVVRQNACRLEYLKDKTKVSESEERVMRPVPGSGVLEQFREPFTEYRGMSVNRWNEPINYLLQIKGRLTLGGVSFQRLL